MGPAGCRNSPPPPATPQGCHPVGPAFTFAPLPSLPLPQDLQGLRGPQWAEDQAQDLSRLLGAQVGRGNLATLPFAPLPSQWSPNFPLWAWDPFPSPSRSSGLPVRPTSTSPSPHSPPRPTSYLVTEVSSHPLRCPWSPTIAW